jgi:hypothetical protein
MIITSFNSRNEVYTEGILLISTLIKENPNEFLNKLQTFNPYLIHGLEQKNNKELCNACIMCLSDMNSNLKEKMAGYMENHLKVLIQYSNDGTFDKDNKLMCLKVYSDSLLMCRNQIASYLDEIFKIMMFGVNFILSELNVGIFCIKILYKIIQYFIFIIHYSNKFL